MNHIQSKWTNLNLEGILKGGKSKERTYHFRGFYYKLDIMLGTLYLIYTNPEREVTIAAFQREKKDRNCSPTY